MGRGERVLFGAGSLLVLTGTLAYVEWRRPASPAPVAGGRSKGSAPAAVSSAGSARLAALEREVLRLRSEVAASVKRNAEAPPVAEEPVSEEEPLTGEERREQREAQVAVDREVQKLFFAELGERVEAEPVDPAWRAETERQITEALPRGLGERFQISAAQCASTLCRVKLNHPEIDKLSLAHVRNLARELGELGTMEIHYDTKSVEGATTVYLLRQQDDG